MAVIKRRTTTPLRAFVVEASSNLEHSSLIPFFLGQLYSSRISLRGRSAASLRQNCVTVFSRIFEIGRAVQQECRDRSRMPSSACNKYKNTSYVARLALQLV